LRFRFVLIPLVLFLISAGNAFNKTVAYRENIEKVIATARNNHWPVVVLERRFKSTYYTLMTLDGSEAKLNTSRMNGAIYGIAYDKEGVLHLYPYPNEFEYRIKSPDYMPRYSTIKYMGDLSPDFAAQVYNSGRWSRSPGSAIFISPEKAIFLEQTTGKLRQIDFPTAPPWGERVESGSTIAGYCCQAGDLITFVEIDMEYTIDEATQIQYQSSRLWRYRISIDEWDELRSGAQCSSLLLSSDGSLIIITEFDGTKHKTSFIDSNTGMDIIAPTNDVNFIAGDRWVVGTAANASMNQITGLVVYDRENNWNLMNVQINNSANQGYVTSLQAIYEP